MRECIKRCGDCIHYPLCAQYVERDETFPEIEGGCKLFKREADVVEVTEVVELLCKIKTQIIETAKTTIEDQFTKIVKVALKETVEADDG